MLFILFLCSGTCICQTPPQFEYIKLDKAADFRVAEPFVLQTASYLLLTAHNEKNEDRIKAIQFLSKWMIGTPDYSFDIVSVSKNILKEDRALLGVYMAALTKLTLQNKETPDPKAARDSAVSMLITYCTNSSNGLKMSKPLKKLAEAKEKGELKKELIKL